MILSSQIKSQLKAKAHSLKPVVWIGDKGLSESVMAEINLALTAHELIKIKISGQDKDVQAQTISQIIEQTGAGLVQTIGHIATVYKAKNK